MLKLPVETFTSFLYFHEDDICVVRIHEAKLRILKVVCIEHQEDFSIHVVPSKSILVDSQNFLIEPKGVQPLGYIIRIPQLFEESFRSLCSS